MRRRLERGEGLAGSKAGSRMVILVRGTGFIKDENATGKMGGGGARSLGVPTYRPITARLAVSGKRARVTRRWVA